jgi:DHA1 family multidrug resistance protein-like MFS transporter
MFDLIRDSSFGQIGRYVTKNKYLQYSEEQKGFQHPHYPQETEKSDTRNLPISPSEVDCHGGTPQHLSTSATANNRADSNFDHLHPTEIGTESEDLEHALGTNPIERLVTQQTLLTLRKERTLVIEPTKTSEGIILVDWYTTGENF